MTNIPIGATFFKRNAADNRLWIYIGKQGPTTKGTYRHTFVREVRLGDSMNSDMHKYNLHLQETFENMFVPAGGHHAPL